MLETPPIVPSILDDTRKINSIIWHDKDESQYIANSTCDIVAYPEPGLHCNVPWIAVYINGQIKARVPAYAVTIIYA